MTAPLKLVDSALIDALVDSVALTGLIGASAIFNGKVPSTSAEKYPRVTVGDATDRDALGTEGATFNKTTRVVSENIHIWTQKTRAELLSIYSAIYESLHRVRLLLATGEMLVGGTVVLVADLTDPDGKTLHGIVRYSATVR